MVENKGIPVIIGLTGGIGSGKSTVSEFLKILGIPVYNADEEAKKLYDDLDFCEKLKMAFGEQIFNNNKPDKKRIAEIVFNNKEALFKLNALIHPMVKYNFQNWVNSYKNKVSCLIQENAIIFESGFENLFSKIVCIYTPVNLAVERVRKRDGVSEKQVLDRMKNQMNVDEKASKSDFVIYSDDKQLVLPQVLNMCKQLIPNFNSL